MRTNLDLSSIPTGVLIGMGVLILAQVTLAVVALVTLYHRPAATVATGNKWIWAVLIVIFGFIGPILYFAIGRKAAQAVDQPMVVQKRSSAEIADALYGTDEKPGQS